MPDDPPSGPPPMTQEEFDDLMDLLDAAIASCVVEEIERIWALLRPYITMYTGL